MDFVARNRPEARRSTGKGRVTLTRIAEELKVSPMTVSNAYNRPDQLSKDLRERIFETARRLGYTGPDPVARSLRRRKTNVVGVLYSNPLSYAFDDPAAVSFLGGLSAVTEEAGLGILLVPASGGSPPAVRDPRAAAEAAVDGFVVYSMADEEALVGAALGRNLPMVVVDQPLREGVPFVGIDDEAAARVAAEHLLALGHKRFCVVSFGLSPDGREGMADVTRQTNATYRVSRLRLEGYAAALKAAGLSWAEVPVYECAGSAKFFGRDATEVLLSLRPRPTAILALSDQLALGAIEAAKERELAVPEDVSVVGFDDVAPAETSTPPLTTVHQDHAEKGLLAGRILTAQLCAEDGQNPELLPTRLVVRGSTASPRNS